MEQYLAYLRGTSRAEIYTAFTMAKTRVAPIQAQTLPRLELYMLAALLGAQLSVYLIKTLQLTKTKCEVIYWSDSQIVLSWISSTKQLHQICSYASPQDKRANIIELMEVSPSRDESCRLAVSWTQYQNIQRQETAMVSWTSMAERARRHIASTTRNINPHRVCTAWLCMVEFVKY